MSKQDAPTKTMSDTIGGRTVRDWTIAATHKREDMVPSAYTECSDKETDWVLRELIEAVRREERNEALTIALAATVLRESQGVGVEQWDDEIRALAARVEARHLEQQRELKALRRWVEQQSKGGE